MPDDTEPDPLEPDRRPLREDFARMLQWVTDQYGISDRKLAELVGWRHHTRIYRWLKAESEPFPWQVFAIERAVSVPPGTLSRTLGYLPPEARSAGGASVDFDEALDALIVPVAVKRTIRFMIKEFTPKG